MKTSNFCMKVERSNFILVLNSALSTNVFLQSKCNMHGWLTMPAGAGVVHRTVGTEFGNPDSSLIMPDFDLTGELSLKMELHMPRPITEKVHSGNGPVSLVVKSYLLCVEGCGCGWGYVGGECVWGCVGGVCVTHLSFFVKSSYFYSFYF